MSEPMTDQERLRDKILDARTILSLARYRYLMPDDVRLSTSQACAALDKALSELDRHPAAAIRVHER